MDGAADRWGVLVNEASINATHQGLIWWTDYVELFKDTDRMTCVNPAGGGQLWHIACEDDEVAEIFMIMIIEDHGVSRRALKVKRLSECAHLAEAA